MDAYNAHVTNSNVNNNNNNNNNNNATDQTSPLEKHTFRNLLRGVSKSFRTGCLERELQIAQLSATRCSCIAIL
jgi:hypothetical protein